MNEQVLDKLKKILRLAANPAATQGEIESAMARAKEIAMQHDIDLAMVDHTDPNAKAKSIEVVKGQVAFSKTRKQPYHYWIQNAIHEIFGVYVVGLNLAYVFIGDKDDVATAREIFIWLEELFPREFQKKVTARELACCAAHYNGFYRGFSEGLLEVNRRAVKETLANQGVDTNKYAMVLRNKETAIEQAVPTFFPHLRKGISRRVDESAGAAGIGREEGRKVRLSQVGGTSSRNLIS